MQYKYKLKLGIRGKILLILLSILLTSISISSWLTLNQEKEDYLAEVNQRGQDISGYVAKSLSFSIISYDYHTIQLLLDNIVSSDEVLYAEVINKRNKIVAKAGEFDLEDAKHYLVFSQKMTFEGEDIGALSLALSTEKSIKRIEGQRFTLITREALIILLIAVGQFIALSFIIINPIKVITKAIGEAVDESGHIHANIPITSNDEFGLLALKFNDLGTQLNQANYKLEQKIEAADKKLIETNQQLLQQAAELKLMNDEFRLMSITDPLTGLHNRRYFEELIAMGLNQAQRHNEPSSILIIDVDHFKSVNDTYGHLSGDVVLKAVANCMSKHTRKTDILCRVGGEEFAVLCNRIDKKNLETVANKLRQAVEKLIIPLTGQMVKVTVSIGGTTVSNCDTKTCIDELYRQADNALYYCKRHGRNQYVHYLDMPSKQTDV